MQGSEDEIEKSVVGIVQPSPEHTYNDIREEPWKHEDCPENLLIRKIVHDKDVCEQYSKNRPSENCEECEHHSPSERCVEGGVLDQSPIVLKSYEIELIHKIGIEEADHDTIYKRIDDHQHENKECR